jgi:hypothetical protein
MKAKTPEKQRNLDLKCKYCLVADIYWRPEKGPLVKLHDDVILYRREDNIMIGPGPELVPVSDGDCIVLRNIHREDLDGN